jgi:DUF971 family protein
VAGHWQSESVIARIAAWVRAARAWQDWQGAKFARIGDNMRQVAVTEGDKVSAEMKFGFSVNGYGIGDLVAIRWADAAETFHRMDRLRSLSPSAETSGERDLLGKELVATDKHRDFSGVTVISWNLVGSYAIQFRFSDGHNTGLYSYEYLREIADDL